MRDFRKLIAWQKARALALAVHRAVTDAAMPSASSSTRNQLLRAIASIPANIAEGCGKRSDGEFARYLDIALGSAKEVENHLLFVRDMQWMAVTEFNRLEREMNEVQRILYSLSTSVRSRLSGHLKTGGRLQREGVSSPVEEGREEL